VDDNFQSFDTPGDEGNGRGRRGLPFELNLQTVATGVLIVALLAILWLFFWPQPAPETTLDLPTATAAAAMSTPLASPGAGTPLAAGSPVTAMGTAAAIGSPGAMTTPGALPGVAGSPVAVTSLGTPAAPGTSLTPLAPSGPVAVGQFVVVGGTDGYGIRLRFSPGTDSATIYIAMDGETFKVLGGPEAVDGTSWWRVQDNAGHVGWAAAEYLQPGVAPPDWNPPAASPTFPAQTGGAAAEASATP
jgi:hypothetical protein